MPPRKRAADRAASAGEPPKSKAKRQTASPKSKKAPAPAVPVQPADVEAPLLPAAEQSDAMQVDDSVADASTSGLYLITPEAELAASQEMTSSADLMELYALSDFERQLQAAALPTDFAHLLPPALASLAKSKWRVMQHERAGFDALLSAAPVDRPMQHFPLQTMKRAFLMRRREGAAAAAAASSTPLAPPFSFSNGRPAVPCKLRRTMFGSGIGELSTAEVRELLEPVHARLCRSSFGKQWGNPFALVITPETCAGLGVPRYFEFVKVRDIALQLLSSNSVYSNHHV
jgi:hypothetical protein